MFLLTGSARVLLLRPLAICGGRRSVPVDSGPIAADPELVSPCAVCAFNASVEIRTTGWQEVKFGPNSYA